MRYNHAGFQKQAARKARDAGPTDGLQHVLRRAENARRWAAYLARTSS